MSNKVDYKDWQKKGNERHLKFPYKRLYNKLIRCAERKNIKTSITYVEFLCFTEKLHCFYCYEPLKWVKHGKTAVRYNLDRKNTKLGYSVENCIECCWKCNNSKSNKYTHEEWYGMTKYFREKHEND